MDTDKDIQNHSLLTSLKYYVLLPNLIQNINKQIAFEVVLGPELLLVIILFGKFKNH